VWQKEKSNEWKMTQTNAVTRNDEIGYAVRTQLPDKKLLSEKLQRAIAIAKEHYANKKNV